jgi:hypothetical protein
MARFGVMNRGAGSAAGAYSLGTAAYPVVGFPTSAYRGNNKWGGGGVQSQPSPLASAFSNNALQIDPKHFAIALAVIVVFGYAFHHMDEKR